MNFQQLHGSFCFEQHMGDAHPPSQALGVTQRIVEGTWDHAVSLREKRLQRRERDLIQFSTAIERSREELADFFAKSLGDLLSRRDCFLCCLDDLVKIISQLHDTYSSEGTSKFCIEAKERLDSIVEVCHDHIFNETGSKTRDVFSAPKDLCLVENGALSSKAFPIYEMSPSEMWRTFVFARRTAQSYAKQKQELEQLRKQLALQQAKNVAKNLECKSLKNSVNVLEDEIRSLSSTPSSSFSSPGSALFSEESKSSSRSNNSCSISSSSGNSSSSIISFSDSGGTQGTGLEMSTGQAYYSLQVLQRQQHSRSPPSPASNHCPLLREVPEQLEPQLMHPCEPTPAGSPAVSPAVYPSPHPSEGVTTLAPAPPHGTAASTCSSTGSSDWTPVADTESPSVGVHGSETFAQ
jgi:hypothetical protein